MSTIPHLEFSGTPHEIGLQLGRFRAGAIRDVVLGLERFQAQKSLWQGSDRLRDMEAQCRRVFPDHMRELDGIAEGAGLPFEDIFIWNCRGDLPLEISGPDREGSNGCTTVLSREPQTGRRIIAHNEDGHVLLDGLCAFVSLRPDGAMAVHSFHYPGLIAGHNFGFNDAGLVQTVNNIRPDDLPAGLPRHLISRASLAAPDLDTALGLFRREDRAGGFHYALAQAGDPRLLSIEAPGSGCVAREVETAAHANHLIDPAFADTPQMIAPSSHLRQTQAQAALDEATEAPDGAAAQRILADRRNVDYPICLKSGHQDATSFTLASALFEIDDDGVSWQIHADPAEAAVLRGRQTIAGAVSDAAD